MGFGFIVFRTVLAGFEDTTYEEFEFVDTVEEAQELYNKFKSLKKTVKAGYGSVLKFK